MNNEKALRKLVSWSRSEAQIHPENFDCEFYDKCNASTGSALGRGSGCMMSYVGRQYGSNAIDEGFRLMIVGIDHGAIGGGTFEERRDQVEGYHQNGDVVSFNQHYRGVVKTAAAVFGKSGEPCWKNCRVSCQKSRSPEALHCVIDRIVQPNNVKCTPMDTKNATSRATWTMKTNCTHHLASELKLLKPKLVVFHGAGARWSVLPELKACGLDMEPIVIPGIGEGYGPILYRSKHLNADFLFLHHPSRGWLDRQWDNVVEPAFTFLRNENIIPAQEHSPRKKEVGTQMAAEHLSDFPIERSIVGSGSGEMIVEATNQHGKSELPNSSAIQLGRLDGIEQRTQDTIDNFDVFIMADGQLHLKHSAAFAFATITADDLARHVFRIFEEGTGTETTFASAAELVAAGWVID